MLVGGGGIGSIHNAEGGRKAKEFKNHWFGTLLKCGGGGTLQSKSAPAGNIQTLGMETDKHKPFMCKFIKIKVNK